MAAIEALELAELCSEVALEKKAENIVVLDVIKALAITDYFVIATGKNTRHLRSIADEIRRRVRAAGRKVGREEAGGDEGKWLLVDLGDVVVHLFDGATRKFYDIDHLWADAPRVR